MKRMLALLISLLLAVSSFGAVAEDHYTASLNFDLALEEIMALTGVEFTEEEEPLFNTILSLVEKTGLKLIYADEQMQFSLTANDIPVVSLTGGMQGDQIVLVSDLFPSYYLTLSQEALNTVAASRPSMQMDNQLTEKLNQYIELTVAKVESYIGQPVQGEFWIDEELFTTKIPINITLEEIALLGMDFIIQIASDPDFSSLLSSAELDPADLLDVYAQLQQQAQHYSTPCEIAIFSRMSEHAGQQEIAITFAACQDEMLIAWVMLVLDDYCGGYLVAGDSQYTSFDAMYEAASGGMDPDTVVIEWGGAKYADGAHAFDFLLTTSGIAFALEALTQETETGCQFDFSAGILPIISEFISVTGTIEEGGILTLPLTTEGKTAISLDALLNTSAMQDPLSLLQPLVNDIEAYGLNTLLSNLIIAMPEDAGNLITQLMVMQMQTPNEPVATPVPTPVPTNNSWSSYLFSTPQATDAPAPTQAPSNPGFFGKPGK